MFLHEVSEDMLFCDTFGIFLINPNTKIPACQRLALAGRRNPKQILIFKIQNVSNFDIRASNLELVIGKSLLRLGELGTIDTRIIYLVNLAKLAKQI